MSCNTSAGTEVLHYLVERLYFDFDFDFDVDVAVNSADLELGEPILPGRIRTPRSSPSARVARRTPATCSKRPTRRISVRAHEHQAPCQPVRSAASPRS